MYIELLETLGILSFYLDCLMFITSSQMASEVASSSEHAIGAEVASKSQVDCFDNSSLTKLLQRMVWWAFGLTIGNRDGENYFNIDYCCSIFITNGRGMNFKEISLMIL